MRVVSVVSLKGGVGKTSVTLGLAGAAWDRGLKTLVVDLDPQRNATTVLDPAEVRFTSTDLLADPGAGLLPQALVVSGWGPEVSVVAADGLLERYNAYTGRDATLHLRIALSGLADVDLVLIDSPPSLGGLTRNALAAADFALVVTEPSLFALQGARAALEAVQAVQADNLRPAPGRHCGEQASRADRGAPLPNGGAAGRIRRAWSCDRRSPTAPRSSRPREPASRCRPGAPKGRARHRSRSTRC